MDMHAEVLVDISQLRANLRQCNFHIGKIITIHPALQFPSGQPTPPLQKCEFILMNKKEKGIEKRGVSIIY
jgi:hypothetical protein